MLKCQKKLNRVHKEDVNVQPKNNNCCTPIQHLRDSHNPLSKITHNEPHRRSSRHTYYYHASMLSRPTISRKLTNSQNSSQSYVNPAAAICLVFGDSLEPGVTHEFLVPDGLQIACQIHTLRLTWTACVVLLKTGLHPT